MDCETKAKLFFPMFVSRIWLHKKLMPCRFIAIVLDIAAGSDLNDDVDSAQKFWCDFKQQHSEASLNVHLMHKKLFFSAFAMHEFIDSYNLLLIIVQNCFYGAQWGPWLAAECILQICCFPSQLDTLVATSLLNDIFAQNAFRFV